METVTAKIFDFTAPSATIDFSATTWAEILEFVSANPHYKPNPDWASVIGKTQRFASLVEHVKKVYASEMEGSEKQIEWAKKIRDSKVEAHIKNFLLAQVRYQMPAKSGFKEKHERETLPAQSERTEAIYYQIRKSACQSKASYYINNRENNLFTKWMGQ